MIDPLIFAAYLIVAGVGSVFAVSQLIRIARKGGPHGTRSRAAAERLDLFPPDVELGAVQRTDADAVTVSDPDCAPDADRIRNAIRPFTKAGRQRDAVAEAVIRSLTELERKRFADPHRYRNARTGFGGSH